MAIISHICPHNTHSCPLQNWISHGLICTCTHCTRLRCGSCEYMCGLFALCVCMYVCFPSACICPSKQSWQANLIWPGKGQPHSNCLSLTLCTDAPSHLFFSLFTPLPFLTFLSLPFFVSSPFTFPCPLSLTLFCFNFSSTTLNHSIFSLLMFSLHLSWISPALWTVSPLFC